MSKRAPVKGAAPAVRATKVEVENRSERLHGNLERPVSGESVEGFWMPLLGWALSPAGEPVGIHISQGAQTVRRLARRMRRPDLALAYPDLASADRSGFSLALDALRLPNEFDVTVAGAIGEQLVPLARIRGARRGLRAADGLALTPLTVSTLGRTGSTLMMTLLSLHPSIGAFRPVAYDSRPFAYCLDAALAMAAPGSRMRLLDSSAQSGGWWLGQDPVPVEAFARLDAATRELLLDGPQEELLQAAVRRASRFARDLLQGDGSGPVSYAAEKCWPGHVPRLLRELCPKGKEIFLVRDFRDVLASILAFNAKRGYPAFGREHVDSDAQFLERLSVDVEALASSWRERREGSLLVRYEELVSDAKETLERVWQYLRLESSPTLTQSIIDEGDALLETTRLQHRTTAEAATSSGRWRVDLSPALQEDCTRAFEGPLRQFGYL